MVPYSAQIQSQNEEKTPNNIYINEMNFSRKIVENLLHMPAMSPLNVMGMKYGDMCIPLTSALLKTNGKKNIAMKLEFLT
jgi:hypothetical protein